MDTIQAKIDHWFQLHKQHKGEKADAYYWQELWPYVLEQFLSRSSQYAGKFDNLITLVGFSPEPIILTILALKPKEVDFIVSEQTRKMLDIIVEKTQLRPSQYRSETVDSSNIEEVYQAIRKFTQNRDLQRTAVDISGGKKSMVGGAAQAAGFFGCAAFYVDNEQYNKELRKPVPGTEYLNFLRNPYQVFGDLETKQALKLYEAGDFNAAVESISRLLERAPELKEARIQKEIFAFHLAWESYLFEKALKHVEKALTWIERYSLFGDLKPVLQRKMEILQKITEQNVPWIVLNHFAMARRYAKREKYDFAILLLYRTLELAVGERLKEKYGLEPSNPDYQKFPDLLPAYQDKVKMVFGDDATPTNNLPLRIGLMAGMIFLDIFEDELVAGVDLKRIREQADNRNQGILAHGLKPNSKKQYWAMEDEFKPILKRFVAEYFPGTSFEKLVEEFKLVPLEK